jgi:hypothetical protein
MTENIKPGFKLGKKGNTIFAIILIVVMIFILFGGKGASTTDLNGYARTFDPDKPGSAKLFDVGSSSKVAIIRHEDGTLTGLAFRKIPLIDRWKVTKETVPFDFSVDDGVWMTVDDGFKEYVVISDGEKLTLEENHGYYGVYARILYDVTLILVILALVNLAKWLWKRRANKKEIS